jgi:hypothetical protein
MESSFSTNSRIQDKNIYYGIRNHSILALVNYIKEFNDVNRVINFQGNKYRLIHLVSEFYNEQIMDAILAMKPNLDLKDGFGNTALHIAVSSKNYYAVEKLLEAGCSKDIKDKDGMTPIMRALLIKNDDNIFNNYAYVILLHKADANLYITDNNGNNMVHIALLNNVENIINIITYLIENDVELNVNNKFNKTALQIVNEKTKHLNNNNLNNNEKLNKQDAGLLTAQTLIFNEIIKANPDIYNDFINVNDLSNNEPLIEVIKYKCVGDNVSGFENKNECLLKGGEYKMLHNNNLRVKFDINSKVDEDMLYIPQKSVNSSIDLNSHPLIQKINENASKQLIQTSTENQYAGEYINRDIISFKSEKFNNINKKVVIDKTINISPKNILEGFNNSKNYIINEKFKEYKIIILTVCLLLAFILILYKLTVKKL